MLCVNLRTYGLFINNAFGSHLLFVIRLSTSVLQSCLAPSCHSTVAIPCDYQGTSESFHSFLSFFRINLPLFVHTHTYTHIEMVWNCKILWEWRTMGSDFYLQHIYRHTIHFLYFYNFFYFYCSFVLVTFFRFFAFIVFPLLLLLFFSGMETCNKLPEKRITFWVRTRGAAFAIVNLERS